VERMIDPDRALELVFEHAPKPRGENCPVSEALGRVLAEEILSDGDHPPFDRAMMDGFAVRVADAGGRAEVAEIVAAGRLPSQPVTEGLCAEIMTGAPCPEGTEAVVPVEATHREGKVVTLPAHLRAGDHVQPRGTMAQAGDRVLGPGDEVTPLAVASLSAFGRATVEVYRRLRVAIITTGDELLATTETPSGATIRDTNGPMLAAMAREGDAANVAVTHASDTEASLTAAFETTIDADIVVLSGGVSAGRYDLVPQVAATSGFEPVFHKVTQKPGKPLLFATDGGTRLLFGLPGNPRSSHFCFTRYVAPMMRAAIGRPVRAPARRGRFGHAHHVTNRRTLFMPVRVDDDGDGGFVITPLKDRGSADLFTTARANGYVRLEAGEHHIEADEAATFEWMGGRHG